MTGPAPTYTPALAARVLASATGNGDSLTDLDRLGWLVALDASASFTRQQVRELAAGSGCYLTDDGAAIVTDDRWMCADCGHDPDDHDRRAEAGCERCELGQGCNR